MSSSIRTILFHTGVVLLGLFMVYPILWAISSSVKPEAEIFQNASSLIPSSLRWDNYVKGWAGFGNFHFGLFFQNSLIITTAIVMGTLISSVW